MWNAYRRTRIDEDYGSYKRTFNKATTTADCVNASSVNMFKNKIDKYLRWASMNNRWTLDKPRTSFSTCHLGLSAMDGNLDVDT